MARWADQRSRPCEVRAGGRRSDGPAAPHGDSAIYDTLVRMAQPFSMRLPFVDGHGNFGSPDDGPAAMRYTECRLSAAARPMLESIDEDVVDFGAELRRSGGPAAGPASSGACAVGEQDHWDRRRDGYQHGAAITLSRDGGRSASAQAPTRRWKR